MSTPQHLEITSNVSPPRRPVDDPTYPCQRILAGLADHFPDIAWTPIVTDAGVTWHCFDTPPGPSGVGLFLGMEPVRGGWALSDLLGGPDGFELSWAPTLAEAATDGLQVALEALQGHIAE